MPKQKPPRKKKRDKYATLKRNAHLANDFIVWGIDGMGSGVKWRKTWQDIRLSRQEEIILTKGKYEYLVLVGACGRDENGNEYLHTREIKTSRCSPVEVGPIVTEHAKECFKELGQDALTSFYFAITDVDFEFRDDLVWGWVREKNTFDELINRRELEKANKDQTKEYCLMTNFLQTQVGGNHYTCLAIQPRMIITWLNLPYDVANMIKYLSRYQTKNGSEDLRKAFDYAARLRHDFTKFPPNRLAKGYLTAIEQYCNQFDPDTAIVLRAVLDFYVSKPSDEEFKDGLERIMLDINHLHELKYKTTIFKD